MSNPLKLKCTPKRKLYTLEYEPVQYFTLTRDIQKAAKLVRSPRRKEIKHVTKTIYNTYIQVCTERLVVTETHSKNAVPRNVGTFDKST